MYCSRLNRINAIPVTRRAREEGEKSLGICREYEHSMSIYNTKYIYNTRFNNAGKCIIFTKDIPEIQIMKSLRVYERCVGA